MRRFKRFFWLSIFALIVVALTGPTTAFAQESAPSDQASSLLIFTRYPSQEIGIGEILSTDLTLRANTPQLVNLSVDGAPEGWNVSLRGRNRVIDSVYVDDTEDAKVTLRVETPPDAEAGDYSFTVVAKGKQSTAELPITLTLTEKAPPSLSMQTDLPVLRGKPSTTFRYDVTLKNDGDVDLNVNLSADAPPFMQVTFKSSGKEVTDLPLEANAKKRLSVEAKPLVDAPADTYPITLHADGGEAQASVDIAAEIVGQSKLKLTTPDSRLSGKATAGKETTFTLIAANNGSAPARNVKLSASQPNGWTVTLDPETIDMVEPGQQMEVTARVKPADKTVAGDYMLTFRAQPEDASNDSVDFRVTVTTSTLWGVVGLALIAVALGVVALAVVRFGRR